MQTTCRLLIGFRMVPPPWRPRRHRHPECRTAKSVRAGTTPMSISSREARPQIPALRRVLQVGDVQPDADRWRMPLHVALPGSLNVSGDWELLTVSLKTRHRKAVEQPQCQSLRWNCSKIPLRNVLDVPT